MIAIRVSPNSAAHPDTQALLRALARARRGR